MKSVLILSWAALFSVVLAETEIKCSSTLPQDKPIPQDWITMANRCVEKTKEQVGEELTASLTYFAMGVHFSQDNVNLPGFANLFFESATEEREHATKLLGYLSMRGIATNSTDFLKKIHPLKEKWDNGVQALEDALKLEAHVTRKIRHLIQTCETVGQNSNDQNDYHFVDHLTGEFLEEQHKGSRDLAGKLTTLKKMYSKSANKHLAQFLFDKKLLKGEV